jgi:hypothetical protein
VPTSAFLQMSVGVCTCLREVLLRRSKTRTVFPLLHNLVMHRAITMWPDDNKHYKSCPEGGAIATGGCIVVALG